MMNTDMKRSPLISIVNVLQLLLGSVLAALSIYLVILSRSPETLADPDPAGTVHGLLIGAAVLGVPALITLIGVFGLWKRRFWGWVLSLATDVGTLAVFVFSMIHERELGSDEICPAAGGGLAVFLVLLPAGGKVFLGPPR